jgi:hypothetical protein
VRHYQRCPVLAALALAPTLALAEPLPLPKPPGPGGSCPHGFGGARRAA